MDIGKPQKEFTVEPLVTPIPEQPESEPVTQPEPDKEPVHA